MSAYMMESCKCLSSQHLVNNFLHQIEFDALFLPTPYNENVSHFCRQFLPLPASTA